MHMPVMDGVELAERISRIESLKNLPLVMLSSAGIDMPEHTQTKMFIRAWLTKPVNQSRLYDCLLRVTAQHKCGEVADIPAQSVKASVTNIANLRVLLVEDNPINQDVAGHMLTNLGCQYEVVVDGRQAVAKYQSKAFDLILMDCYIPVMDGHTATGAIRELESKNNSRRIPIIALTANAMAGDREKCLAAGMDDHLAKPFKGEALAILVQKWTLGEQPTDYTDAISPETNVDAKQLLDFEIFDSLRELDAASANSGFLKKLLKTYLDIAPRNIEQISEAISKGDADALKSAAHSLKGSSANLGALEFAELCQSLETKGRQNSLADSPLIFSLLTQHYEELRSNLVAELRTIKQ